jgi:hypothetical protein
MNWGKFLAGCFFLAMGISLYSFETTKDVAPIVLGFGIGIIAMGIEK